MNTYRLSSFALLMVVLVGASCDKDDETALGPETSDIVETAEAAGIFNTLLTAVEAAGLAPALRADGPLTVFAPTDAAFNALPAGTLDALLADPPALTAVLLYHVVEGEVSSGDVISSSFLPTLNGQALSVSTEGAAPTVAGAGLADVDIEATNGLIHEVDQVLIPSSENIVEIAAGNPAFSTLVTAIGAADLAGALQGEGPFTVFAPTDDAFAAVPSDVLQALLADVEALASVLTYHVVEGRLYSSDVVGIDSAVTLNGASVSISVEDGSVQIDGSNVVATDIQGTNGVIHVVDQVILPPNLELDP